MGRLTKVEQDAIANDLQQGISPTEVRKKHQLTASQLRYYAKKFGVQQTIQPPTKEPKTAPDVSDIIETNVAVEQEPVEERLKEIPKQVQEEYGCPKCQGTFDAPYRHCPHCGVALQW